MTLSENADRLILSGSVEGNVFPKAERDVLFPLTIKPEGQNITVHGSIYARAIDIEPGNVLVHGPIASRGTFWSTRMPDDFKPWEGSRP